MRAVLDPIKRFFGMYDSNGVKYSVRKLESITDIIPYFSLEEQAEYADIICVKNAKNKNFLNHQFRFALPEEQGLFGLDRMNTTAVGNMAFLALHAPDEKIRERCKRVLENYRNFLNS
jgi:hypothetical protein